ncbi:MAG: exo-beta-N-acetylmuramidase NamZ domain-containing protein [Bacteroidota bacterium]
MKICKSKINLQPIFRIIVVFIVPLVLAGMGLMNCSAINTAAEEDLSPVPAAYQTEEYVNFLAGKKVGILANQTSEVRGVHLIDTLLDLGVDVVKVFSPEHGFRGTADAGEAVSDYVDPATGIPIISLYGNNYKPTLEQMEGIEIMIFDVQDVGVRFFTYLSSLHYLMEACAETNTPLIILDRPNPNGFYVDGPVLKEKHESFIGLHPVPVVYGLTLGEFAGMINAEKWLKNGVKCPLTVIKCRNYTHDSIYHLPVKPSPNLPDMRSVYLYPSIALFEGTVVSEGRGTHAPFQVIGHPEYPDTAFSFTPKSIPGMSKYPKFRNQKCYGLDLRNISIEYLVDQREMQFGWLMKMYEKLAVDEFFIPFFDNLTGDARVRQAIVNGKDISEVSALWKKELKDYLQLRKKYLLYPD